MTRLPWAQERHRAAQQLDAREGVGLALQDQHRLGDGRPVLGAQALLRLARQVQRVGEADDAGDPAAGSQRARSRRRRAAMRPVRRTSGRRRRAGRPTVIGGNAAIAATYAGTASSALRLGRSMAWASTPRARRPSTCAIHRGRRPRRAVGEHEADGAARRGGRWHRAHLSATGTMCGDPPRPTSGGGPSPADPASGEWIPAGSSRPACPSIPSGASVAGMTTGARSCPSSWPSSWPWSASGPCCPCCRCTSPSRGSTPPRWASSSLPGRRRGSSSSRSSAGWPIAPRVVR